jgi:membrane-associated phospholipid phosphatase
MQSVLAKPGIGVRTRLSWNEGLRTGENIALVYFIYTACIGFIWPLSAASRVFLCTVPLALWSVARIEHRFTQPWSSVARDWLSLALILVGYWEINLFKGMPLEDWQAIWIGWDRAVLEDLGIRALVESFGAAVPALLELVYLLLYAIPPACMGILYLQGRRRSADRFLSTLFFGTFFAYALLPLVPSVSPRIAFPAVDVPAFTGFARMINTWVLDHLDISTSVFPSGHVAVAFSSAFGLREVIPRRKSLWIGAFAVAALVYVATIYGRYHYAADGLASLVIAYAAARIGGRWSVRD